MVRQSWRVALCAAFLLLKPIDPVSAADPNAEALAAAAAVTRVQVVVDRLRGELGIPDRVQVSVLPQVALIVSVEAPTDRSQPFHLMIESRFLERLTPEEIDAAIAHELGHVWVFTHHPYLQTERLANQIAMRVVTRDSLANVYYKLWQHGGTSGDLESYLGPRSQEQVSTH